MTNTEYKLENSLVPPYNENLSHLPQAREYFNVKVVFKYNNTVKQKLIKNSP